MNGGKPYLSEPNRVSRESLLASHRTSMSLVARRILRRRGSASSGRTDASTISQKITSWGSVLETKATFAQLVHGQRLVCRDGNQRGHRAQPTSLAAYSDGRTRG